MTFTALSGAVCHFAIGGGISDYFILISCILFTFAGAMATAQFANKVSTKIMNRTLGIGLSALAIAKMVIKFL